MAALMELTWIVSFSLCLLINGKLLRADALVTESITNKETTPEKTKAETTEHIEIHNLTPSVPTRRSDINYTVPYYHEQQVAPKEEPDTGRIAGIIIGVLGGVAIFTTLVAFLLYKHYLRRNVTSMNFDNPVYRKTTEDQFSLEKNQYQPARSYPPSLEPLTSPGTNEFV